MTPKQFRKLIAMYHFLAHYHSGQTSRGYRYLSILGARLRNQGILRPLDFALNDEQQRLYIHLFTHYKDSV